MKISGRKVEELIEDLKKDVKGWCGAASYVVEVTDNHVVKIEVMSKEEFCDQEFFDVEELEDDVEVKDIKED